MSQGERMTDWLTNFQSFLMTSEAVIPHSVSERIRSRVRADLNPPFRLVAAKLLATHIGSAIGIMAICPQLGVEPLIAWHGIMMFFMRFGSVACASLCGALFLGASALIATIVLRKPELRVANRHRFLTITFLAAVSFTGLILAGGEGDRLTYLFWILGAVFGGWAVLRAGAWLRLESYNYNPR